MKVELKAPFIASDRGDIDIFITLDAMASHAEVYDLDGYEFFDSAGLLIVATAEGYTVRLTPNEDSMPRPERLEELLRSYFARLPEALGEFSSAALQATTLDELIEFRTRLESRPR